MPEIVKLSAISFDDRPRLDAWTSLLAGEISALHFAADRPEVDHQCPEAVFPGAFNPLHYGHLRMAEIATARLGVPTWFEISVMNVDKASIHSTQAYERVQQFQARHDVLLTRAPTFIEKARLFRASTFVVGADTMVRIGEARYYGTCAKRDAAIAELTDTGCKFLVFGRRPSEVEASFDTLSTLTLPKALAGLCHEISEQDFRADVSSTELREGE